ncbi:MAG: hydrogenase nickel incorporation protein HypB [Alphaproteobacteria bacterium]|nr:hydrogenase nickel incorporation protein HypB [Alphaproteobacteria bacterium]
MCGTCGCESERTDRRVLSLEIDLMSKNDAVAARNRAFLAERGILAVNLMSSPGSGKTSLLVRTLELLRGEMPAAVIEGDQATTHDTDRIRACGVPAMQINTGQGCHLDAEMIARVLPALSLPDGGILFIENVGNLVCPAGFDLGEGRKVVLASLTEGEDKPLKYAGMFAACGLMLVSKCDLLEVLDFDIDALEANAHRVNPEIEILRTSARTDAGLADWVRWLRAERARLRPAA